MESKMSASVQDLSEKTFDYVIIGGGTAGLTVAARLSEDPHITVAVLEAGLERLDDPIINIPAQYGKQFGDARYSWDFATVPQAHANNRSLAWPRGKILGGSSAINFYLWNNPPAADIDAWEALGNPGWNWGRFSEYAKKTEGFTPPDEETAAKYRQKFNLEGHGPSGPLKTTFPQFVVEPDAPFQQALLNAGIKVAKDPQNGDPIGTWMAPCTLDPKTQTRSYSATAFYQPNSKRPNLRVLCGALVHRLVTSQSKDTNINASGGSVKADAVEFEYDGNIYTVFVGKEVILSAGALKSPQLLELSGIGNKDILEPLGIKTILDLPGVGSNLQEHMLCGIIYELDSVYNFETLDSFANATYVEKQLALHASGKGAFTISVSCFSFLSLSTVSSPETAREIINRQRQRIEAKSKSGTLPAGLKEQYQLLLEAYENGPGGECEVIFFPGWFGVGAPEVGKNYVTIMTSFNRPFSRGTIHVSSKDPCAQPEIDPHYFEENIDLETMTETAKFIRRISELEPFKKLIVRETTPGPSVTEDGPLKEFLKNNFGTTYHTAGTLSMLPRALNGAVDPNLRVYGTQNIRVADLSIAPLHIAAHTQSTAYAIGEQAADIIRGRIPEVK